MALNKIRQANKKARHEARRKKRQAIIREQNRMTRKNMKAQRLAALQRKQERRDTELNYVNSLMEET